MWESERKGSEPKAAAAPLLCCLPAYALSFTQPDLSDSMERSQHPRERYQATFIEVVPIDRCRHTDTVSSGQV
ncbi:hypothetical protein BD309DRAFT_960954 [Dichomitus squalens]|nr:hypothetical protein BD309DRAFT_960954 [Dichomitus squalens]